MEYIWNTYEDIKEQKALQESNTDRGIRQFMEYLGHTLHGERTYIFELSDKNEWNNTYEWCANHVISEKEFFQNIPYDTIHVWLEEFLKQHFVVVRDVEAMKKTGPECYEYLERKNIQSIIVGPLYEADKLIGFYGIDNPQIDKMEEVASIVKTISHVIETMLVKRALVHKLEALSYNDQMLKLGNRYAMHRYLEAFDRNQSIGIVYCDVCGLKRVNDTLGHAAGDELLLHACECLKLTFPEYKIYRIGGDEMLVLAGNVEEKAFLDRCESLKLLMLEKDVPLAVGIVWKENVKENPEELIAQADAQMYQNKVLFYKNAGLNRWRSNEAWFGTTTRYEEIVECVHSGLEKALEEGQFVVYYQPQYNQREVSLYGAEALVRWIHPEKGIISPNKFIPYLEQNGMISKLDEYVLRETCRYQRKWLDAGMKVVPISVNLSRTDLQSEEICYKVKHTLEQFELSPENINLEVTETAYMEQPEEVIEVVKKFQELGYKVEMDDFGSGYSSLNSLKDIPVDMLKLDMRFMSGDSIVERSGKILSSVIRMAHWLGMPVIAEGVETEEQAEFLCEIGCFYVQGYFFDRPLPVSEFEKRLIQAKPDLQRDSRLTRKSEIPVDYFSTESDASLLLDNALGAVGIIEYDGKRMELLRSNRALYEMFGITTMDSISSHYSDVFYKGRIEEYKEALDKAVKSMDKSECEALSVTLQNPDKPFWTRTKFKYLRGYDGIYTFFISVENIDKERKAQYMNSKLYKIFDQMEKLGAFGSIQIELNESSTIGFYNEIVASMLGYTMEEFGELVREDIMAAVAPEDREYFWNAISEAQTSASKIVSEKIRHICKDGSVKLLYVLGVTNDISSEFKFAKLVLLQENMMAETASFLLNSNLKKTNYLMDFIEFAGISVMRYSTSEGRILDSSKAFVQLLGYTIANSHTIQYDIFQDYVWEEDRGLVHETLQNMMKSKQTSQTLDFRIKTIQREAKWVHTTMYLSTDQKEIYISFEKINRGDSFNPDEVERKRLEEVLGYNSNMGMVYYSIERKRWQLEHISDGNLKIFGYEKNQMERLAQNDILALVHPEDRELLREYATSCAGKRKNYEVRYRMLKADGEYICVLTYGTFTEYNHKLYLCQTNIDLSKVLETGNEMSFCIFETGEE